MKLQVECYSGHKADQRPVKFWLGDAVLFVESVEDQWYVAVCRTITVSQVWRGNMSKHLKRSLTGAARNPEPLKISPKPHVRYVGFERIEGGRRLKFSVKPVGHESVEFTTEVSDAAFIGGHGISIQDAAPMAYEKIVELLVTQDTVDSNQLFLSDTDIAEYIVRHLSSQKRAASMRDGTKREPALHVETAAVGRNH